MISAASRNGCSGGLADYERVESFQTEKKSKDTKLLAEANNHQALAQTSDKPRNRPTHSSETTKFLAATHEATKPFHVTHEGHHVLKTPIKASSMMY